MRVDGLGEPAPGRVAFDLVLDQAQGTILVDHQRVQADAAPGHREVAKGCVIVREREVLARVAPVAGHDQAHRRVVRADQRASELAAQLQRRVDAALELGCDGVLGHGHALVATRPSCAATGSTLSSIRNESSSVGRKRFISATTSACACSELDQSAA